MRVLPTSVRTRLTLWYTVLLTLPLIAFAITSYVIFATTLHGRTDAFLDDALTVFGRELAAERRANPVAADVIRRTLGEVRFREIDIVILDAAGNVVGTSLPVGGSAPEDGNAPPDPATWVPGLTAPAPGGQATSTLHQDGRTYRVLQRPLTTDGEPFRLIGVHSLTEVEATLGRIRRLFLVVIPLIILSAATGGYFLVRRSFRPVSEMAARAAEIGTSTLHERLPSGSDDELGELARVLNDLLNRLESSFLQQRRFMADASHELRTPTAIVRAEADVTLARPERTVGEYRASMRIVQDASRRLTRIVDDIFLIARADAGHLVTNREPLYLEDLVRDTVRTVKPIADARNVRVALQRGVEAPMFADADLLGRLILNLLDNAIKHSPAGTAIDVSMRVRGCMCDLSIIDAGPGIPAEARERIFERFFRVDVARSREGGTLTSGAGLGLSICRRIAELHGGRLDLIESRPGHTEFRATLPVGAAAGSEPALGG